ncbi:hypothetical protein [Bacillus kexueae]|uniref:hypothetical protein n=1 Tax=Aeribacillus kexueae TaxID=2078952 RepID=UPI001FAE8190|nr:hypothetical protein [Bacillus kexueae]
MQFIFLAVIVGSIVVILDKMLRKKMEVPSNHYTPFNDLERGEKTDSSTKMELNETKKDIPYEEVDD